MGRLRAGPFPIDLLAASILAVVSAAEAPAGRWAPWLALSAVAALAWLATPPRRDGERKGRGRSGRRADPAAVAPRTRARRGPATSLR